MSIKDLRSFGETLANRTYEYYSRFKEQVDLYYLENSVEDHDLKDTLTEKDISRQLLRISIIAFTSKTVFHLSQQGWLAPVLTVLTTIMSIPVLLWTGVCSSYGWALPILSGIAMTIITWYTVFIDSYIPGVFPVSPLSPQTHSLYPSHFHLGYIVTIANGILLAFLMYFG